MTITFSEAFMTTVISAETSTALHTEAGSLFTAGAYDMAPSSYRALFN